MNFWLKKYKHLCHLFVHDPTKALQAALSSAEAKHKAFQEYCNKVDDEGPDNKSKLKQAVGDARLKLHPCKDPHTQSL